MKKIFSFLLSGVLSLFIYASGITIGGKTYAVDTIVHSHDIGPGTKYAFYDIPAYPLKFHVMEVDLTNPYVDIETCLSGDKAVATETPSSMSARNNRPGHEVLGATPYKTALCSGIGDMPGLAKTESTTHTMFLFAPKNNSPSLACSMTFVPPVVA